MTSSKIFTILFFYHFKFVCTGNCSLRLVHLEKHFCKTPFWYLANWTVHSLVNHCSHLHTCLCLGKPWNLIPPSIEPNISLVVGAVGAPQVFSVLADNTHTHTTMLVINYVCVFSSAIFSIHLLFTLHRTTPFIKENVHSCSCSFFIFFKKVES